MAELILRFDHLFEFIVSKWRKTVQKRASIYRIILRMWTLNSHKTRILHQDGASFICYTIHDKR